MVFADVGLDVDRFSAVSSRRSGEYDQEQHDVTTEVFAVPSACRIVRRPVPRARRPTGDALPRRGRRSLLACPHQRYARSSSPPPPGAPSRRGSGRAPISTAGCSRRAIARRSRHPGPQLPPAAATRRRHARRVGGGPVQRPLRLGRVTARCSNVPLSHDARSAWHDRSPARRRRHRPCQREPRREAQLRNLRRLGECARSSVSSRTSGAGVRRRWRRSSPVLVVVGAVPARG